MAYDLTGYHAVLAVKDERGDAFAACGGLRSLTAARAVIPDRWAILPRQPESEHEQVLPLGSRSVRRHPA